MFVWMMAEVRSTKCQEIIAFGFIEPLSKPLGGHSMTESRLPWSYRAGRLQFVIQPVFALYSSYYFVSHLPPSHARLRCLDRSFL